MRTRAQRIDLVYNVVAHLVHDFSNPELRGSAWEPSTMIRFITSEVKTQAFLANIPDRHHAQMVEDGLTFYNRHLKSVMARLVALEARA